MEDKCGRQVGDKCKLMRSQGTQSRKTSVGDKWETSLNSCGSRNPEWETSAGDKCGRLSAAQGIQSVRQVHARQVWETSGGQV